MKTLLIIGVTLLIIYAPFALAYALYSIEKDFEYERNKPI